MAKCRLCGRHGIFMRVSADGFCSQCERRSPAGVAILRQSDQDDARYAREYRQSEAIKARLMAARSLPLDQQIEECVRAIEAHEHYLGETNYAYVYHLVHLLRESGQGDRAWSLLNELSLRAVADPENGPGLAKVRWEMYEMEKEAGHYLQAVEMHASYYVLTGNPPPASYLKTMRPMAKKAGLSPEQIEAVEALVRRHAAQRPGDEAGFTDDFRRLVRAQA